MASRVARLGAWISVLFGTTTTAAPDHWGDRLWESLALIANEHHCEHCRTSPTGGEDSAPHYHFGPSWRLKLRSVEIAMRESGHFDELMKNGQIYQFGVGSGWTMGLLRRVFRNYVFVGFDSFEGLSEEAVGVTTHDKWQPGVFNYGDVRSGVEKQLGGPSKVRFVKGFFNTSLTPSLKSEMNLHPALYIDMDVDLYISTIQALEFMFTSGLVQVGTLISYDDWWILPCWRNSTAVFKLGAGRAHLEIAQKYGVRFKCVAGPCKYSPGGRWGRCSIYTGWGPVFAVVDIGADHFDSGFSMTPLEISRWASTHDECYGTFEA